ncbi:MAG TPA: DUF1289 domain-containing protein [Xanthobacteraceae bacterium]|nr:DUF1289 domain-containing protein [Xanthobacteraceae bacterium]
MVTPCINVCVVHPVAGLCIGCGRTIDEIARWSGMSDRERDDVIALLPRRLSALGGGAVSQKG